MRVFYFIPAILATALIGLIAVPAGADEAGLTAQLSAAEITLDDTVQLTITLSRDSNEAYRGYTRPDLAKDFDILHQGQAESTQWSIANGRQSVRTVEQHIYLLHPKHKGACNIPPASAHLGGHDIHTQALVVQVSAAAKRAPGAPPLQSGLPGTILPVPTPDSMRGDEDIFIEARADKTSAYLGEPVIVSWWIYTQSDILRYRTTVEPKHDDFWSEDLYTPPGALAWDRAEVKGRPYQAALLLKRALFPLKAGRLTVTSLEAEATTLQTAFYPGGSAVRGSRPITIEALPLPAAGRPEGFEATNVGRYDLGTSVDKTEVKAGDAVTLKVTVRGEGNIRNVKLKKLEKLDGFRMYEPTLAEHVDRGAVPRGDRVYTYLLLPEKGGDLTIPSVSLAYFDPAEKKYAYARSSPIAIHVEGDPSQLGRERAAESKENTLGPRLRLLRTVHKVSSRLGERILRGPLLAFALGAPPGLLAIVLLGNAIRVGLSRETAGRKRRRARAAARRRMKVAEGYIKAQRPSAFFAECARALYEHLEYRLGEKCEALTLTDLRDLLVGRGFDEVLARALVTELESSDFARFAPSASGPGEMRAAIRRVKGLLTQIERTRVSFARAVA